MFTLSLWDGKVGQTLLPLVEALNDEMLRCSVLHADESPIQVLTHKGDAKRAYIWAFSASPGQATKAVIYEINDGRSGEHARRFLRRSDNEDDSSPRQERQAPWCGHLMVDDFAGYKALFQHAPPGAPPPVIELGCWAHARRKFHELFVANRSPMAEQALQHIAQLYAVEADIKVRQLDAQQAQQLRAQRSLPRLEAFKVCLAAC